MTPETEFYLKLLGVFVASGVIFYLMELAQRKKQAAADAKYEQTMKMIELRDRKYEEKK